MVKAGERVDLDPGRDAGLLTHRDPSQVWVRAAEISGRKCSIRPAKGPKGISDPRRCSP